MKKVDCASQVGVGFSKDFGTHKVLRQVACSLFNMALKYVVRRSGDMAGAPYLTDRLNSLASQMTWI